MLKHSNHLILLIFFLSVNAFSFAQTEVEYKDVILDGKPARLNVSTGEITLVKEQVVNEAQASVTNDKIDTQSDFHIVKEGEGLLDISRKYKVSLTKLKKYNNLETTLVTEGQKLKIRNFNSTLQTETAQEAIADASEKIQIERPTQAGVSDVHIVKKGETLYRLSKTYNLSVNELKRINHLDSNIIKVGQELNISIDLVKKDTSTNSVWTVSKGDTLYSIAKKNGTSVDEIKALNGLTSNLIKIGQKLKLK